MEADVWAFEHPFAAVTDEKGNFEIPNVPANVKVKVAAWHPKAEYLTKGKSAGEDLQLNDKETVKDFELEWPKK
jgi:hypothetical protein